jgi:hypothetical protein
MSISAIAKKAHYILDEIFPANPFTRVFCEHYVNYKGQRLFFDFFIKELSCFVECQGQQHKYRDNLKIDYVQKNNMYLMRINYDEAISKELVMYKINKTLDSAVNFCE